MLHIAEKIIKAPLPGDDVYVSVEGIYEKIMAVKELLSDPQRSSVRIVTNPEKMVIAESRRAYVALSLYGFPVDCVVANRVIPQDVGGGYFAGWRELQKEYMSQLKEFFTPMPINSCPLFNREMVGLTQLAQLAETVFPGSDPSQVYYAERPFTLESVNKHIEMKIKLPGVDKNEIDLWTKEDELIITVGGRRRNFLLPRALRGYRLTRAKSENGIFTIIFQPGE